ncbi:hypothetical protein CFC21_058265 [Triticum aestivum]|uniref:Uncharacterized protein n=3 Tax=Triticum TaxID=4564 RepID=A0A9R0T861_TRITD|nr:triadin-like isoform X2 [Triticum aestivum]KAF7049790.1 hypothetical protein CFC21_058265 [Triticum aestivum]VAI07842.1 unnamed protein product [Triticum turgidum subsp. durum]
MSRCFPYPPPGYVRNPVAVPPVPVVETTAKKERERAEKKEKRRNDKKASHPGGGETKHSKRSHKKRKHEDTNIAGPESKTASKEQFEQLEKSGLSEEYGAPSFIQTIHGSPESSQDSSKRRKVVLPGPSQSKNGTVLRIKIKRDQESPSAMSDGSRVLQQPPVQQMATPSSLLSKQNAVQPCRDVMVKSAAGLQQSIKRDTQSVPKQMDVKPPATILQRVPSMTNIAPKVDPPTSAKITQKIDTPTSAKIMQKIDPRVPVNATPSSAKVKGSADPLPMPLTRRVVPPPAKAAQRVDIPPAKVVDIPPVKVLQKVDPLVPSKVLRRDAPPPSLPVLQKETIKVAASNQPDRQQQPVLHKPKGPVGTPLVQQQQSSTSLAKEEPCSSGRNTEKGTVPEAKQSKSDRKKSRKAEKEEKKERKFRDLFVTWNPPSLEIEETGNLGDQDWLLGGAKKPDASNSSCKASDGLAPMELEFSWQPRAIHLPDLHMYQLPYVVPL